MNNYHKVLSCLCCGAHDMEAIESGIYRCNYCGAQFKSADVNSYMQSLKDGLKGDVSQVLYEQRCEDIAKLRQNLYAAIKEEYTDSQKVINCCNDLKKYLPDDFQANCFSVLNGGRRNQVNKFLDGIDVNGEARYYIKDILDFMLKSLTSANALSVKSLADRALSGEEKTKYINLIENELLKYNEGVYNEKVPRKAFIAYSSKDMTKVNEIVNYLEEAGISCFVALRNMRHGRGSVENYGAILRTAMHSCKCFVFLSSRNSRMLDCDAITVEVPYVRDHEPQVKRIEYIIDDYGNEGAAKAILKDFFGESEQCRDKDDLVKRLYEATSSKVIFDPEIKFCRSCGAENAVKAKFCVECGDTNFVATKREYLTFQVDSIMDEQNHRVSSAIDEIKREYPDKLNNALHELEQQFAQNKTEIDERQASLLEEIAVSVKSAEVAHADAEGRVKGNLKPNRDAQKNDEKKDFEIIGTYLKRYNGSSKNVIIPNTVKQIGENAFFGNENITSVVIPNSVTYIGEGAFYRCSSLISLIIPNNVIKIGKYAFSWCRGLINLTMPDSITSIGDNAFDGCETHITISAVKKSIGGNVFSGFRSFKSITISDGITKIGDGAFSGCSGLVSLTMPNSITVIGDNAFSDCSSLTSITISDGVTKIGDGTFSGCCSLISITVPQSVTEIGARAFSGCHSLTSITIPDGVTFISGSAFDGCSSLTSITIPDRVIEIGEKAFAGCSNLTNIIIPDSVTEIAKYAFSGCIRLKSITISNSITSIGGRAFDGCWGLTNITIPNSVTSIGISAFSECRSLTSITIPNRVTRIAVDAFEGCSSLTSINIPDGVTEIGGGAFDGCNKLTRINIPDSVTEIGSGAFRGCSSLKSIFIPKSVEKIRCSAFEGCKQLTVYHRYIIKPRDWEKGWNRDVAKVVLCLFKKPKI